MFQHTAARRQLARAPRSAYRATCFNTQPPEGSWKACFNLLFLYKCYVFQHTAARRQLGGGKKPPTPTPAFQHTAARRQLVMTRPQARAWRWFQHTAARRQLGGGKKPPTPTPAFQHTAARRQLACTRTQSALGLLFQHTAARRQLAHHAGAGSLVRRSFNTQPPEGSWQQQPGQSIRPGVSTHSRPKAAGNGMKVSAQREVVSTHSRPKAAGVQGLIQAARDLSFNTQPPEGGWPIYFILIFCLIVSTHSRPKAAGVEPIYNSNLCIVSTHSRPKAAGVQAAFDVDKEGSFNTQPPEGGWLVSKSRGKFIMVSTHSRPKAAGIPGLIVLT